jgi:hypothetical protein
MAAVGNTRETILPLHSSFAVLFSLLFSRQASNPERSHEKGSGNGTVSNRDLLSNGNFLSEISSTLAPRILDWTDGPYLSAKNRAARVAPPSWEQLRVLANPKRGSASKRLAPRSLIEASYPPKPNLFLSTFRFEHFTHSAARNSFAFHGIASEDDFGV